jgi:GGDEF domain-containing protein
MPQTNQEEASFFVRRVLKKIETFSWKNRAITASAGISTYIASSESPSPELIPQFIIQADEALYKSKGAGKNISTHFLDIPEQELTPHKRGHIS